MTIKNKFKIKILFPLLGYSMAAPRVDSAGAYLNRCYHRFFRGDFQGLIQKEPGVLEYITAFLAPHRDLKELCEPNSDTHPSVTTSQDICLRENFVRWRADALNLLSISRDVHLAGKLLLRKGGAFYSLRAVKEDQILRKYINDPNIFRVDMTGWRNNLQEVINLIHQWENRPDMAYYVMACLFSKGVERIGDLERLETYGLLSLNFDKKLRVIPRSDCLMDAWLASVFHPVIILFNHRQLCPDPEKRQETLQGVIDIGAGPLLYRLGVLMDKFRAASEGDRKNKAFLEVLMLLTISCRSFIDLAEQAAMLGAIDFQRDRPSLEEMDNIHNIVGLRHKCFNSFVAAIRELKSWEGVDMGEESFKKLHEEKTDKRTYENLNELLAIYQRHAVDIS